MGRETGVKGPPKRTPLLKHLSNVRVTFSMLPQGWSPQSVLFIAIKTVKVPFECHPAKGDTVGRTRTFSSVLKPSRGRKTEISRARLDQPSFTPPPLFRVAFRMA
jgi:hypothetical protein